MMICRIIYSLFWNLYLRLKGAKIGMHFKAFGPIDILLRDGATLKNLSIGNNVTFNGKVYIRMRKNGRIILDNDIGIGTEVWLVSANDSNLEIGKNTGLGSYIILNAGHGLSIGSHCVFASFIYINTSDHNFKKGQLIREQGFSGSPVKIGDDVLIGGHVFIKKGVSIGSGSVIGAGSIVTKDIPENKIVFGNPAKIYKDRE